MDCSWYEDRFTRFIDGELVAHERARIDAHVTTCHACANILEELRVVDGLLLGATPVALPDDFTAAAMAQVQQLAAPRNVRRPVAAYITAYLAGAWMLIASAFVLSTQWIRSLGMTSFEGASTVALAVGGFGIVARRIIGRRELGDWVMLGTVAALLSICAIATVAYLAGRPRFTRRIRS